MCGLSPGWEVTVSGLNMAQGRRENRVEAVVFACLTELQGETGLKYLRIS
jgi:hypothetical protein